MQPIIIYDKALIGTIKRHDRKAVVKITYPKMVRNIFLGFNHNPGYTESRYTGEMNALFHTWDPSH